MIWNLISGLGHSAVLRTLPHRVGSLNRRICGFAFGYAQIYSAIAPQTSHIPGTLDETSYGERYCQINNEKPRWNPVDIRVLRRGKFHYLFPAYFRRFSRWI